MKVETNSKKPKVKVITVQRDYEDITIRIPEISQSIAQEINADETPFWVANIHLDHYDAKALAYNLLSKCAKIEKIKEFCECGLEYNRIKLCRVCDNDE